MQVKGDISAPALSACAETMLEFAQPCQLPPSSAPTIDIVGTGGDGKDTFNVSTAAGFVMAACGSKMQNNQKKKKKKKERER